MVDLPSIDQPVTRQSNLNRLVGSSHEYFNRFSHDPSITAIPKLWTATDYQVCRKSFFEF